MTNFKNLKAWLKNNDVNYIRGYSEHEDDFGNIKEVHDFIILKGHNIHIYNDSDCFVMDFGNDEFSNFESNKEIYKELKEAMA